MAQTNSMLDKIGVQPTTAVVDLGFRGVDQDVAPVNVIHRGKYKTLAPKEKRWLKRRQAIEPMIGHMKSDSRMDRCWLKGARGDAIHVLSCAVGYNIRWLLRAIARLGIKMVFLRLLFVAILTSIRVKSLTVLLLIHHVWFGDKPSGCAISESSCTLA